MDIESAVGGLPGDDTIDRTDQARTDLSVLSIVALVVSSAEHGHVRVTPYNCVCEAPARPSRAVPGVSASLIVSLSAGDVT